MKASKLNLSLTLALTLCAPALPLRAQWNQNSGVGPYIYTDPANWVGGIINNVITNPAPISGLTLVFTNDFILTNGIVMGFSGTSNVIFQSDSATPRMLSISLGNFLRTNQSGGTITVGTATSPLILNLFNHTRSLGGVGSSGTAANAGTMNINAQIIDTGSNGTNGVALGVGDMFTYLLNNNNTFTGPVSFGFRGGGFSSIKNIGAGASALGAPVDSTNATVTITDSTSFGHVDYVGSGDTTDRPFVWNLTGPQFSFQNLGSGKITFAGQWTLPFAANRTNIFTINAVSNHIQLDGYLKTGIAITNLVFAGGNATNRNILTGPTNDFPSCEVDSGILAYTSISNPGQPSPLGAGTNIIIKGGALQYTGPSVTNSRTLQLTTGATGWSVENASNTLTLAADFVGSVTDLKNKTLNLNVFNTATINVQGAIPDAGTGPNPTTLVIGNATGMALNNGGTVLLANPNNSFSGGVQVKYSRTLQVPNLADGGLPCSIGTGASLPSGMTGINLGSTDSQRGGIFAYVGTTAVSCNRQISVLGLGSQSSGTILNNSPNNSSLHFTDTGFWTFNAGMTNCTVILGGSAAATNVLDSAIPNTTLSTAGLVVNGSIWKLTASQLYSGATTVSNGTLLVQGSLGPGADVTVGNNGVLGGNGTINNNVTVLTGGALSPGASIGSLTINGNLTNSGSILMELNKAAGTNDQIVGVTTLVYGGTLVVTNLAGTLAPGDSFPLFSATTYQGSFSSISPATPGSGLAWDLTGLTNGTLKVIVGASTPPHISDIETSGSNVILSGSGGPHGGTYYVVTSTNVASPLINWTRLATNVFDGSGNFNVTNAMSGPRQFFRIELP
jgi:autotransporter-associated beta strand protein